NPAWEIPPDPSLSRSNLENVVREPGEGGPFRCGRSVDSTASPCGPDVHRRSNSTYSCIREAIGEDRSATACAGSETDRLRRDAGRNPPLCPGPRLCPERTFDYRSGPRLR